MRRLLVLAAAVLALAVVPAMALPPGDTVLVNRAVDGSHAASAVPGFEVTPDGRCVVFAATGAALPGANGSRQVYVRDTVANTTTLVSATPGGAGGDDISDVNDVTPDCRYVAFDSEATDLTSATLNQRLVYRRDLVTGTTIVVSRATGAAGAIPNRAAFSATISDDGNRLVFATSASNLASGGNDSVLHTDLFLRQIDTSTTAQVTRNGAGEPQDGFRGAGFYPSLSGDGTRLAFDSDAPNLSTEDQSGSEVQDVFVKDLAGGAITLVSRASGTGEAGNSGSGGPVISGDGTRVAYGSAATNLRGPVVAPFGAAVVIQVYVRDLGTGETILASRDAVGGPADRDSGGSDALGISTDGRLVAYHSPATNLPGGGGDGTDFDVFVTDLATGATDVAARRSNGTPAGTSVFTAMTGDHVAFTSPEGLVDDDADADSDLYVHRFAPGAGPDPTPTATATAVPTAAPTAVPTVTPPKTIRGEEAFVRGTANDLYLACTKLDLYIVDVLPAGKRVSVTGAADLRLVGRTVDIRLDGKKVGSAVVGSSGAFAAKVRKPARKRRAKARYQAKVGSVASQPLRLVRRMVATTLKRAGGDLVLSGIVNAPRAKRQPAIVVERFLSCQRREKVSVPKVKPNKKTGRFKVRIDVPSGPRALLYRARTKVPSRPGKPATNGTFTLPRAADVG